MFSCIWVHCRNGSVSPAASDPTGFWRMSDSVGLALPSAPVSVKGGC